MHVKGTRDTCATGSARAKLIGSAPPVVSLGWEAGGARGGGAPLVVLCLDKEAAQEVRCVVLMQTDVHPQAGRCSA